MILALNCGSQSIKWKLFDENLKIVKQNKREILNTDDYQKTLEDELSKLKNFEILKIGHRVVHGGSLFFKPLIIIEDNLKELEKISNLAPLHNPYNILGIKACQRIFSGRSIKALNIAVFDTEFFTSLPEKASAYALPETISKKFGFKRYGFHGTSHEYVAQKACEILEKRPKKVRPINCRKTVISPKAKLFAQARIITCHLGGGSSMAAIKNGKAIDTSMGFTPSEGLVMMTRPGSIDAGIVLEVAKEFNLNRASEIFNKESGVKGICGQSDMLEVLNRIKSGDKKAKLALDIFVYSIQKYIGAYFAILGGCDLLVFTGSIGFGSSKIRNMICKNLNILNRTKILPINTDEEFAIAEKVKQI